MNITHTIPIAYWGMHGSGGWWILGGVMMMLMMGAMMWMMMRGMGRGSSPSSSAPGESRDGKDSPLEILERRFAQGEISVEDYRERREVLTNAAHREQDGARADARPVVSQAARKEEP